MSDQIEPESDQSADVASPDESAAPSELTADSALTEWRRLTEERDQAKGEYEAAIAPLAEAYEQRTGPLDSRIEELEAWFVAHAEASGAEQFASDVGTVTISTRESPKIDDADSFFAWVVETNNPALLQKRISVTQFRDFQKDNPDQVPPGVTVEVDRSAKFKPA